MAGEGREPAPALLCYDGSEASRCAIKCSAAVLGPGPAVVLHVWEPASGATAYRTAHPAVLAMLRQVVAGLNATERAAAREIAAEGACLARVAGFEAEALALPKALSVWATITRVAQEHQARAIVLGARSRSCVGAPRRRRRASHRSGMRPARPGGARRSRTPGARGLDLQAATDGDPALSRSARGRRRSGSSRGVPTHSRQGVA